MILTFKKQHKNSLYNPQGIQKILIQQTEEQNKKKSNFKTKNKMAE